MILAVTAEGAWNLGLLGLSLVALLVGVVFARAISTADNGVFRLVVPVFCLLTLGAFAVLVYWARYFVK